MRKLPRISSAPIAQINPIPQGYYYYQLAAFNNNVITIPINTVGTVIQVPNAPISNYTLEITGVQLSVNFATSFSMFMPIGANTYFHNVTVNGITATLLGAGPTFSMTINTTNILSYTIICTAPNQYSWFGWGRAV